MHGGRTVLSLGRVAKSRTGPQRTAPGRLAPALDRRPPAPQSIPLSVLPSPAHRRPRCPGTARCSPISYDPAEIDVPVESGTNRMGKVHLVMLPARYHDHLSSPLRGSFREWVGTYRAGVLSTTSRQSLGRRSRKEVNRREPTRSLRNSLRRRAYARYRSLPSGERDLECCGRHP